MLFLGIINASVCKGGVNAVLEVIFIILKKVIKNVLKYILSTYVLSNKVHFRNVLST